MSLQYFFNKYSETRIISSLFQKTKMLYVLLYYKTCAAENNKWKTVWRGKDFKYCVQHQEVSQHRKNNMYNLKIMVFIYMWGGITQVIILLTLQYLFFWLKVSNGLTAQVKSWITGPGTEVRLCKAQKGSVNYRKTINILRTRYKRYIIL